MWAAALNTGGHLLKKAWKYAKNNPEAIGRGIGTLSKFADVINPKYGNYIRNAGRHVSSLSSKGSYLNKMSNAINGTNNSSSNKSNYSTPNYSPSNGKKNVGGYVGYL